MIANNTILLIIGFSSVIIAILFFKHFNSGLNSLKSKKWSFWLVCFFTLVSLCSVGNVLINMSKKTDALNVEYRAYISEIRSMEKSVNDVDVFLQYEQEVFSDTLHYLESLANSRIVLKENSSLFLELTDTLFEDHFLRIENKTMDIILSCVLSLIIGLLIPKIRVAYKIFLGAIRI